MKETRDSRILQHLLQGQSITSLEAINEYGNTRLSDSIFNLRKKGYKVKDKWITVHNRFNEPTKVKKYYIERSNNEQT